MKKLLVVGAAVLLSGCRFWYKPVPVANAVGDERTGIASDSFNVHRGEQFEIYGPSTEAVYDGYEQLSRAYRAFDRYVGAPGARLAFILSTSPLPYVDSALTRSFRERGFTLIPYVRPRSVRTRRSSVVDYGGTGWPIAPTAARAMLAQFARARLAGAGADSALSDDALLDHYPLWYRAAVIHLVGEAGASTSDVDLVREERSGLLPLANVMREVRSSSGDTLLDPSRRGEADDFTRKLAAQAATVMRYLIQQEGPAVVGAFGRGYLAKRTLNDLLADLRNAPHALDEIESRWKRWVAEQEN